MFKPKQAKKNSMTVDQMYILREASEVDYAHACAVHKVHWVSCKTCTRHIMEQITVRKHVEHGVSTLLVGSLCTLIHFLNLEQLLGRNANAVTIQLTSCGHLSS
jgi:hypothetical protein